jgi:hypothetical protein
LTKIESLVAVIAKDKLAIDSLCDGITALGKSLAAALKADKGSR